MCPEDYYVEVIRVAKVVVPQDYYVEVISVAKVVAHYASHRRVPSLKTASPKERSAAASRECRRGSRLHTPSRRTPPTRRDVA